MLHPLGAISLNLRKEMNENMIIGKVHRTRSRSGVQDIRSKPELRTASIHNGPDAALCLTSTPHFSKSPCQRCPDTATTLSKQRFVELRSRSYGGRVLQATTHVSAFFDISTFCTLVCHSDLCKKWFFSKRKHFEEEAIYGMGRGLFF